MATATPLVELIFGPMFSEKTSQLLGRMRRYAIANRKVLLVKHKADDRYSLDEVSTHDGVTQPAISISNLWDIDPKLLTDSDVIGIDEGQFFPDLASFVDAMANKGKTIVIAALDGTYHRTIFPSIAQVIPLCDAIHKFRAVCTDCGKDAPFTHIKQTPSTNSDQIIGGHELYQALCRTCWTSKNQ